VRGSLRNQILYPTLAVMLLATGFASGTTAWLAARRTRLQIETQLRDVARTLAESTFPLTDSVLRQTRGLSGAEIAVADSNGRVLAATLPVKSLTKALAAQRPSQLVLDETAAIAGRTFFHTVVERPPRAGGGAVEQLHIFYPEAQWRQAWRDAVAPPLLIGAGAMLLMAVLIRWLAANLTRPIARLRTQVEQIAQGDFHPVPAPPRDDEIRDLANSVNRMAEMLARYEEEVRRRERLRTLGQLGGGIAHQMRNAATGCRMALDLYRRSHDPESEDEDLAVAVRQLELMETYLRRFLTLGAEHAPPRQIVDLGHILEYVLPLVRPTAVHLGVELRWIPLDEPILMCADESGLAQLVVNLTLNAIEAAAREPSGGKTPAVEVRLDCSDDRPGIISLEVADNGPGPAATIRERLFEPLVSDKPDGAGLGLAVAKEIAELHRGDIRWERRGDWTRFLVELPLLKEEESRVATVGG
jgi:signal transduction histidine kinase